MKSESFLTIYQVPKKGKVGRKVRERERYHRYRILGKCPTRWTKYADLTDEQYYDYIDAVTRSRMKRYHSDPVYKRKVNEERRLYSMRARQLKDGRVKYCNLCKKDVPIVGFDKRKDSHDGLRYDCKRCRCKRNAEAYQRRLNELG